MEKEVVNLRWVYWVWSFQNGVTKCWDLNLVFNFLGGVFSNEDFGNMLSKQLHCPCKNDKITFLFVSPWWFGD